MFDPGMGSSHKIRRGFRAISTESLHSFADARMQVLMKMNIDRINEYEQLHIDELNRIAPLAGRPPLERETFGIDESLFDLSE